MKWFTHQALAVGAGLCLGLPVPGLIGACAGAILPDVLDQKAAGLSRNRQKAFNRIHRGTTHWFGWWLGAWVLALLAPVPEPGQALLAGGAFGGVAHVLLDLCTVRGIPLFPWGGTPRPALKLCRTGGAGEYLFLLAACLAFFFLHRENILALCKQIKRSSLI